MSEDEKFAAQGRAHARAKSLKAEIATLKVELKRRTAEIAATLETVDQIIANPEQRNPSAPVPLAIYLQHRLNHETDLASLAALIDEAFRKATELRLLEEQIKEF